MRFFGKIHKKENDKNVWLGSDKLLKIELNTGGRVVDYTIILQEIDGERHRLTVNDREGAELLNVAGNSSKKACKHELDRFNRCLICSKFIVN